MASYYVCSDNIDGKENSRINAVVKALEKNGHSATNGGVGPNTVQSHGLGNGSKGQIGVFIVGGSDAGMYVDFRDGLKRGYYHYKQMIVIFASETATTDKWITCNGLANTPLVRAWDDNYSGSSIESVGKSAKTYFDANKEYISYACGKKGCSFEDVIQNFLSGNTSGGSSDSKSGTSTASTIKDSLKKAVSGWDGDVEIRLINETVYVNKIPDPTKSKLVVNEFENVQTDSVTVTDINPQTVNKLTMNFEDYQLVLSDDVLIKRFDEIAKEITPDDTVKDYETALAFIQRECNKIRRDDGRQVELKIDGSMLFKVGQWVRAYLPSFYIDDYMYIIRMSNDEDGSNNWSTSLTLVDYPPSFGTYTEETTEEEEEEDSEDTEETEDATEETTT